MVREQIMKINNKWDIPFGQLSFTPEQVNTQAMLNEIFQHKCVMEDTKVGTVRMNAVDFPICTGAIESQIKEKIIEYVTLTGGRAPKNLTWSAWAHICLHGTGLVPHYHMGEEHLSSIIYLTESKANLVLRCPIATAVRQYPQDMLAHQYPDFIVHPRQGDFCIFPSYIDHYVMAAEPDFRVSLAMDWCFN
jgi:hypothetical protein